MTKASDNDFPSLLFTEQGSTPTTPAASHQRIFIRTSDHKLCYVNSSGTVTTIDTAGGVSSGTSFPGSPADGDLYYRTDLDLLCRYRSTGTRWVTTTLYRETFGLGEVSMPRTAVAGTGSLGKITPWSTAFDLYIENFYTSTYVLTTNNGTNYWGLTLSKSDAAASDTTIVSLNTSAHTVNNWTQVQTAVGAVYVAASYRLLHVIATPTLSPGNLFWALAMSYRLIVT